MASFIKKVKSSYKKSEAIQTLDKALNTISYDLLGFDGDTTEISKKMVEEAWSLNPDIFGGANSEHPMTLNIICATLAYALERKNLSRPEKDLFSVILYTGMENLQTNKNSYNFNHNDKKLMNDIFEIANKKIDEKHIIEIFDLIGDEIANYNDLSWEEWYQRYQTEVKKYSPELAMISDKTNDKKPLKLSYKESIPPEMMARGLLRSFKALPNISFDANSSEFIEQDKIIEEEILYLVIDKKGVAWATNELAKKWHNPSKYSVYIISQEEYDEFDELDDVYEFVENIKSSRDKVK